MTASDRHDEQALEMLPQPDRSLPGVLIVALAAIAAVLAGLLSLFNAAPWVIFGVIVLGAMAFVVPRIIGHWQLLVRGLLVYLPFSGIPSLVFYTQSWVVLSKDLLFVLPAYACFVLARPWQRLPQRWLSPGVSIGIALVVAVIALQFTWSATSNVLVALIGFKVGVFYLPVMVLAAYYFRDYAESERCLRLIALVALVPSLIGIVQALLLYSGYESFVYGMYGPLAQSVTQGGEVGFTDDLSLRRIPSTFTFVGLYYSYVFCMFPLMLALMLGDTQRRWRLVGVAATLIVGLAGVTSGTRGFLLWLPVQVGLFILVTNPLWALPRALVAGGALFLLATSVAPGSVAAISDLTFLYTTDVIPNEFSIAAVNGLIGNGLGTNTGAARYVLDDAASIGAGVENWYAKQLYELGIEGVAVITVLWGALVVRAVTSYLQLRRTPAKYLAASLLVFLIATMINLFKAPFIDMDPMNVYFWFFAGWALVLPGLRGIPQAQALAARAGRQSVGGWHLPVGSEERVGDGARRRTMNHPQVLVTEFAPIVSWEVALACQEAGWLRRYVTSVYFKPSQFPYSIVKDMPRSLRERCLQQLANRDHPEIDKRLVHSMPFVELGHRFLSSQPFVRKRVDWLDLTIAKNVLFDEYVSRFCFEEHDILYAFGSCSLQQLRHARRVESASILESTHVHPTYHGNVLREESRFLGLPNREIGPRWEWWLKRQLEELELADYVATLSNFSRQTHLLNGADPERVFVLEPGVSLTDFYPVRDREATPPGPDRPFRILFVGTISARKGVYYLLEAFKQLKLPNAELLLRGGVDDGMGEILARYDGLFRILPPVPRADLHAYFNDADLFVLPSLLESFGLVIFQAMACGTPVIATTACGATFDDGHEGYVIEPRDVEALKERILRLYDDATLRLRMGQHAAARARHQTWQSFRASTVAMMETVYRERALR